jgi:hypothetical protein
VVKKFDPNWYTKVMKGTSALVLACGPIGSGVKLWTRRRLLGHRDDEVLADHAMAALHFDTPRVEPGDDPVTKVAESRDLAVKRRLAEIKKFAAGAPVVLNWTTRDLGVDAAKFSVENLGLPGALIDGVDVVLYVVRDGRMTDDIGKCFILKDSYTTEPRSEA